jgi:hypothetical protein
MPTFHTEYFRNFEEVEYVFGLTLTAEQREQVQTYLFMGIRPETGGCWTCSPAFVRKLTGQIDQYELAVKNGTEQWPWNGDPVAHGVA